MALSWLTLPCALEAAIGIGKQTLGDPASLTRHRGRSKALGLSRVHASAHGANGAGLADSLNEAKAAFRAAGERRGKEPLAR
jgi:hypothetical protein